MERRSYLALAAGGMATSITGCLGGSNADSADIAEETLRLSTTTSTYDTGLLDSIHAAFDDRFGVTVEAVADGTGAALATARSGDSDVVMVHARALEDAFLHDGYGINRRDVMFNDFVIVGPSDDPVGIEGSDEVTEAFRAIAEAEEPFISRGDSSGTHAKELDIWEEAGISPRGDWYREAGSGMGEVLNQANLTPGYTLSDRGTYLSQRGELEISVRMEGPIEGGPDMLLNPYGIVAVNPGVHDHVNYDIAMAYIGFITSQEGKSLIESYTVDGQQLFFPDAIAAEPNFDQFVPEDWQ